MNKLILYLILILHFGIIIGAWWYFSNDLIYLNNSLTLIALGKLMGIIATQLALLQLILIGRIKWVETFFGLDNLSRVHKWNGFAVLIFIILHIFLVTKGHALISLLNLADQFIHFLRNWENVLQAFIAFIILLITIGLSITIIKRRLKYELWYFVHLLNYLVFILFVSHQLNFGISSQSELFRYYWLGTYAFAFGNLIWFKLILPFYKFSQHQFAIDKVEDLGTATNIYISGNKLQYFHYKAGQFIFVRFLQKGFWWQAHPFSISQDNQHNTLRITVKKVGDFTSKLPQLQLGTKIIIGGPFGTFTSQKIKREKILMIAGGIGITPLRAIAEEIAKTQDSILIYNTNSPQEAVFLNELQQLTIDSKFKLIMHYTGQQYSNQRLNQNKLQTSVPDITSREIFLCGPVTMLNDIKIILKNLKVPNQQIHYEHFSL